MNRRLFGLLSCLATLVGVVPLAAQDAEAPPSPRPEIVADEQEVDFATRVVTFRDNVVLTWDDVILRCETLVYREENTVVEARGNVRLTRPGFRLTSPRVDYNLSDGSFTTGRLRLAVPPAFVAGASAIGDRTSATITDATVYQGEPARYSLALEAAVVTVDEDGTVDVTAPQLSGPVLPNIPLPDFSRELIIPATDFSFDIGDRGNLGPYAQFQALHPVSAEFFVGGNLDGYLDRGILFGPAARWEAGLFDDPSWARAELDTGVLLDDNGDVGVDRIGEPIDRDRWFATARYRQQVGDHLNVRAQAHAWSDSAVTRDFRWEQFDHNQQPDSFAEIVYAKGQMSISALLRPRLNEFQIMAERLPEVRFDLYPTALGGGLYHQFTARAAWLRWKAPGFPERDTARLDGTWTLLRPVTLAPGVRFTPQTTITGVGWSDGATDDADTPSRLLGQLGFDLSLTAARIWDVDNDRWNVNGLRHLVRPVLKYRWRFDGGDDPAEIIAVDRATLITAREPLDLRDRPWLDVEPGDFHRLRIGVENRLQTRDEEGRSRDLLALNLYQDFDFDPVRDDQPEWTFFTTELRAQPLSWLGFSLYNRFVTEELTLMENLFALTIRDGPKWWLRFQVDYLDELIDHYRLRGLYNIRENLAVYADLEYDAEADLLTEQLYGVRYRWRKHWELDFYLRRAEEAAREDDLGIGLRVNFRSR